MSASGGRDEEVDWTNRRDLVARAVADVTRKEELGDKSVGPVLLDDARGAVGMVSERGADGEVDS